MLQIRQRETLGGGDYGWLTARHHFAIDGHGKPEHAPVGCLLVWNDDEVAPHSGFPMHGHRDMEIVTYVREGVVEHEDDAGGTGRITAGNVQAFSAGRGIRHAERNPGDETLKIFQIWLRPRRNGIEPCWSTKPFPKADRSGRFVTLASGFAEDVEAVPIEADARVLGATLRAGQSTAFAFAPARQGYLVAARGAITVNGRRLGPGDGIVIRDEPAITVAALEDAELVMVDAG